MNQKRSLWGGISVLITAVIAILAFVRGKWLAPLLISVFVLWGLWAFLTHFLPEWRIRQRNRQRAEQSQFIAASNPNPAMAQTLLCHVNHRISAHLKSAYPNVRWEWAIKDPALLAVHGGIGRIRIYGIPEFSFADVELDPKANLSCALVKLMPNQQAAPGTQPAPAGQQPIDPKVWYEVQGRKTLETLIADLASRGHSKLTLKEDGSICIKAEDNGGDMVQSTFASFPEKVYWPQLVKVLEQEGLSASVEADCVSVAW